MAMHLAVSLVIRAAVQIARQTSQLQRTAGARSSIAGAFILAAATVIRSWLLAPGAKPPPPATKIAASTMQPARLPVQEPVEEAARSRRLVRRRSHPFLRVSKCLYGSGPQRRATQDRPWLRRAPCAPPCRGCRRAPPRHRAPCVAHRRRHNGGRPLRATTTARGRARAADA